MINEIKHHFAFLLFYTLCFEILTTNSRTSTLWRLSTDKTKIIEASPFHQVVSFRSGSNGAQFITEDDQIFNIITSTVHLGNSWIKHGVEYYCTNCHSLKSESDKKKPKNNTLLSIAARTAIDYEESLDCGKPVNFTYYDNLVGVLNRHHHPNVPEPQAGLIFKGNPKKKTTLDFDIQALEHKLKKAKREKPKSVQLYNQIGNFWRIKGDTEKAIECFRRALAVSPHNAEVLLNLGRVLFTLQYLDDAIFLTKRSIEVHPPDKSAWQQYFTLGEIFKAYGHYQEASMHFKHSLQLNPDFEPAEAALKDMETAPFDTIHAYTLLIIIFLVLGVLLVILSSVESISESELQDVKSQRQCNKGIGVKSLRLAMSNKNSRWKKVTT